MCLSNLGSFRAHQPLDICRSRAQLMTRVFAPPANTLGWSRRTVFTKWQTGHNKATITACATMPNCAIIQEVHIAQQRQWNWSLILMLPSGHLGAKAHVICLCSHLFKQIRRWTSRVKHVRIVTLCVLQYENRFLLEKQRPSRLKKNLVCSFRDKIYRTKTYFATIQNA